MTYKNSSEILSFIDSSSPSKQSAEFLTQAVKDENKSERVLIFPRESVKDDRLNKSNADDSINCLIFDQHQCLASIKEKNWKRLMNQSLSKHLFNETYID